MLKLLIRLFVKDPEKTEDPEIREAYGTLTGIMGIAFNIMLFIGKYVAGTLAASIAITADAFNNLSDAGSSLITLFGFKLAGQKPHSDHPFGHGRYEYIAGLIVSLLVLMMGFSLAKESLGKIISPSDIEFNMLSIGILVASILVKLYMFWYNRYLSKKIDSVAMGVTATDSISDACATTAVLISMIVSYFTGLRLDGYIGMVVALMILYAGFNAAKSTISPLLGNAPDPEFINKINGIVRSSEIITGIHDLVIHDYGAGRRMISLHAEVPANGDILEMHDEIDLIERRLAQELCCHAVIHMDPVEKDNEMVNELREKVRELIRGNIDEAITIHDFRVVPGPSHTNVVFDAVLPYDSKLDPNETKARITKLISEINKDYFAVVTIDHPYGI